MSRIKIEHFGPIREGYTANQNWMDIKKVTVLIGDQGSGKSTVAKLVSTFTWLEKALVRGDLKEKDLEVYNRFQKKHCAYQNIHNFFRPDTRLEFQGAAYDFSYEEGRFRVLKKANGRPQVPKVMYVPAERNFVSAVVQPEKLRYLPLTLFTFLEEFIRSNEEADGSIQLPINNLEYRFDKKKRDFKIIGDAYEILLSEASSGLQSAIPLFLVSKNLAEGIDKESSQTKAKMNSEDQKRLRQHLLKILLDQNPNEGLQNSARELLSSLTKNDYFVNVVEEPEQNLYPVSQRLILNSLLGFNNLNPRNQLIMTTHSPYLVNYLTLAVKAEQLSKSLTGDAQFAQLYEIVPQNAMLHASDMVIYELDETTGLIQQLETFDGLPSDENRLNGILGESNEFFAQLLELETHA
jgi:predicted ATPase